MFFVIWLQIVTLCFATSINCLTIDSVVQTCPVKITHLKKPTSIKEIQKIVRETKGQISLAGARGSQGGQIAYPHGTVIDMTNFSRIISIDPDKKLITVEAGATWRDIQEAIDPYDLSVRVMQSYNDFTVGGSASVNVHARMVTEGPMIGSIEEFTIVLADGSLVTANRKEYSDLFYAVIGGYGLLGIIVNITLRLTNNEPMEQQTYHMKSQKVHSFFQKYIHNDPDILFFNAVLYPHAFDYATIVTFSKTNKNVTITERLGKKRAYNIKQMIAEQLIRRVRPVANVRTVIQQQIFNDEYIVWRNYEMSCYSINDLKPLTRYFSNSILQEYFVPVDQLDTFLEKYKKIVSHHNINILNASIRYVPADTESILSYAPVDSYSIVLYINIWNNHKEHKAMKIWTQKLIDAALSVQGTFYLPYHLYATKEQFKKAYPKANQFLQIKEKHDPCNKFKNMLFDAYLVPKNR